MLLLVNACKKEIITAFDEDRGLNPNVKWAKDYYEKSLVPKTNLFMSLRGKQQMNTTAEAAERKKELFLFWESSAAAETDLYDFVEVPLKSNFISRTSFSTSSTASADDAVLNAGFDRLIIYKDSKGLINQRIVSYIPDKEYLARHSYKADHNKINNLDKDFFGYLQYKDWEGNSLFLLRIENGVSVKKIVIKKLAARDKTNSLPNAARSMVVDAGCVTVVSFSYERYCYYNNWWDEFPIYCSPYQIEITGQITYCYNPNEPGTGGGGGGDDSDCTNPLNFGNGNCSENVSDIIDNLADTCLKKVLNLALNNDVTSKIDSIFKKLNANVNIKIKVSEDNSMDAPGRTANFVNVGNTFSIDVFLNKSLLNNASKEFILGLMMHEILHAYFRQTLSTQQQFQEVDHETMADNYVLPLANYLVSVFNISQFDATALAWGGLTETKAFKDNDTFIVGSGPNATIAAKSDLVNRKIDHYLRLNGTGKDPCK